MADEEQYIEYPEVSYRLRIMACVAAVEVLLIGVFNFWPALNSKDNTQGQIDFSDEVVAIDEAVITRQESRPPPPPKPTIPIPVPNDKIIEDKIVKLDQMSPSDYSDSLSISKSGTQGNSDKPVANPQEPPSIIRIVEPTVPDAAKKANIKAEIWVNFLVNKEGEVEDANISQIKLYDRNTGKVHIVQTINYGLTEATLEAALQWKFRPARENGKPVKAYSNQIFTYGFD